MSSMKGVTYTSVMDPMIDQARRYEELVEKHRAANATPAGTARVGRLLAHLDRVSAERAAVGGKK